METTLLVMSCDVLMAVNGLLLVRSTYMRCEFCACFWLQSGNMACRFGNSLQQALQKVFHKIFPHSLAFYFGLAEPTILLISANQKWADISKMVILHIRWRWITEMLVPSKVWGLVYRRLFTIILLVKETDKRLLHLTPPLPQHVKFLGRKVCTHACQQNSSPTTIYFYYCAFWFKCFQIVMLKNRLQNFQILHFIGCLQVMA